MEKLDIENDIAWHLAGTNTVLPNPGFRPFKELLTCQICGKEHKYVDAALDCCKDRIVDNEKDMIECSTTKSESEEETETKEYIKSL